MNQMLARRLSHDTADLQDFVTVQEAAAILRISQSTLWRWIKSGTLHGYYRGGRRVWLLRSELAQLATPIGTREAEGVDMNLFERMGERRLTAAEQRQALAAVEAAERLQERLLRERGGRLFRPADEDIAKARHERSARRG
jgi:excisionase family DNA binding protein